MKAVVIERYGAPEVLQLKEVPRPGLKPEQLLIQVHAASVNPIDWKIRQGQLKLLTGNRFPLILGFDVSGEVVAVGDRVTLFRPGDAVFACLDQTAGGAYAESAPASEKVVCVKPKNLSHLEAAAVPLAGLTALQALRDRGKLQPGQSVLINGASGGVGSFAVQIAKIIGAAVTGVCSTGNLELVKSLGCDRLIDYTQQDFTQEPETYDLIFDAVGHRSLNQCKAVLAPHGIYVTTRPSPAQFWESFLSFFNSQQRTRVILMQPNGKDLATLKNWIEAGQLRPILDRTYSLADLAAAHAYSQEGHAVGKIVIQVMD